VFPRQLLQLLLLACAASTARSADAPDACRALLPGTLSAAAAQRYPDYRPPLVSDNAPQDVAFNLKQHRSGCLGVASADMDGDGVPDFVLGLTPLRGSRPLAVVAFARGQQWIFKEVDSGASAREQLYVDVVPPGTYSRDDSLGPAPVGEERQLTCAWSGAIVGVARATAIVYCLARGNWRRVAVVN
jgi:hypothetical protein